MEKELNQIIDTFIEALDKLYEQLDALLMSLDRVSASFNKLESDIKGIIALYKTRELEFRHNLIALYKKYNKPHPLELEKVIAERESELKELIEKNVDKVKELDEKITARQEDISPLMYQEFLQFSLDLSFDSLKDRYKKQALNPSTKAAVEEQIKKEIRSAIKYRHERDAY